MEPLFSAEEDAWRAEVRAFLDEELPPEKAFDPEFDEDETSWEFAIEFTRKVGERGWIGLTWPEEYGGLARPRMDWLIMTEEFSLRKAPFVNQLGWGLVCNCLFYAGTDEQKKRFLPGIRNMETFWLEGLSEPGAGSDLASLSTRGDPDADGKGWRINGQKTYTTFGSHGDYILCAVRTDRGAPRHHGISLFAVDMNSPGVALSALWNIGGGRQNHTYFDDVYVPPENLIGSVNTGWQVLMNRFYGGANPMAMYMAERRQFNDLVGFCQTTRRRGRLLIDDPLIQEKLGELDMMIETERLMSYESLGRADAGHRPRLGGALSVVVSKEHMPRWAELVNDIVGPLGQLSEGSTWAPLDGEPAGWYRQSFKTHAGGTPQVKRMVLATRGLGLPR